MQSNPKKWKLIALAVALLFWARALCSTLIKEESGNRAVPFDDESMALFKGFLILVSVCGFVIVFALQIWKAALFKRFADRGSRLPLDVAVMLISFPLLLGPVVMGEVLYFGGMPLREFFYFLGTSVVMTVIWTIVDLRKTAVESNPA